MHFVPIGIIGFLAIWCGVVWMLSRLSGWSRLATFYPYDRFDSPRDSIGFCSLTMRWWWFGYNGCIRIEVFDDGIALSVWPIFRLGHRAIFIPWWEIESYEQVKSPIAGVKAYELRTMQLPGIPIRWSTKHGDWIREAAGERWPFAG